MHICLRPLALLLYIGWSKREDRLFISRQGKICHFQKHNVEIKETEIIM